jgi:hypothetical protein
MSSPLVPLQKTPAEECSRGNSPDTKMRGSEEGLGKRDAANGFSMA